MLSPQSCEKIRRAFVNGSLKVQSVSPEGLVEWKPVLAVHRAAAGADIWEAQTEDGPMVLTGGHRVFVTPTEKMEMGILKPNQAVLGVRAGVVLKPTICNLQRIADRLFMYDLTAADWHNFVLHRSRVVISNSPDRNYHFRPPEHEADIGSYNRVFGYVWEDLELLTYLRQAVDWWDMFPPRTYVGSLDRLVAESPTWRTAIQYGGMSFALMALAINWVHEEFDYSIGGVSLSIEKSSKYESLKSNAEGQFDKGTEAKARTTKYIRGLQQPRYGIGIRSAFGPAVGKGILSPRNFL